MNGQNGHNANGNGRPPAKRSENGTPHAAVKGPPVDWAEHKSQKTGKFTKGNPGGPGRPPGKLNLMAVTVAECKRDGVNLERLSYQVLTAMARKALRSGDAAAAKLFLDRVAGPIDKVAEVTVAVGIDARGPTVGPPVPGGADFRAYIEKLNHVAAAQGLIGDTTPEQLVEGAVRVVDDERDEIEELLS